MTDQDQRQHCAVRAKDGIPAGCAAIIETAAGLMVFGEPGIGEKMLRELLETAERSGCASRPQCRGVLEKIAEMLAHAPQDERKRA